ncbi:MAG: hypothetical protein PHH22_04640 [Clostridia bacterium]|nr:hypothetical protein [Clostridia bacterium]
MKRFLSITLIICIFIVSAFVLSGCTSNNISVGSTSVKSVDNKIIVKTNDGATMTTTTYVYTNNVISSVKSVQDYYDDFSNLEEAYNNMVSEPIVLSMYTRIEKKNNTLELEFADVLYEQYENMSQEELYNYMKQLYNAQ